MHEWPEFTLGEKTYDLTHLNGSVITVPHSGTENHDAKDITIYLSYGDHCFTEHYGEDDSLYPAKGYKERFFCQERYNLSKNLPEYIPGLLSGNPYLGRTFLEKKEQFFYVESEYMGVTYRLFLDIDKSNHPDSDIRVKIVSAYEEDHYSEKVKADGWFKFFRIAEARMEDTALAERKAGRRARKR